MAGRIRSLSRISLAQLVAVVGCGPGTEPPAAGTTDTTGFADAAETAAATTALDDTAADVDVVESSGTTTEVATSDVATSDVATTESEATGAPECDPVVPGEFNPCWEPATGQTHARDCHWMGTSESVAYPGCLISATIADGNVCMLTGCEDRCDCFAQPATGTARVECMEGVIAEDTVCVLWCAEGQTCPDGMVCGFNVCFWEPT